MAGIYVHVPFCSSFCIYCDFYSEIRPQGITDYKEALKREIALRKSYFKGVLPETLYFGGGTPSLLPVEVLEEIVYTIKSTFGIDHIKEFTIEVNPDDIVSSALCKHQSNRLEKYKELGINRISMGVQSFDDSQLKWMNRRHSSSQAVEAYRLIRNAGFENISLDLIFGYSMLDNESWNKNISKIIELSPEHISCYQMSIEPGSTLGSIADRGEYVEPSQEQCADQYALLQNRLSEAGYNQYEISNFAKPGYESKHNSSYWNRTPYLGLGPAAHSLDENNVRFWNPADLDLWSSNVGTSIEKDILSEDDIFNEQIMLGLRQCRGLKIHNLDASRYCKIKPAVDKLIKAGNICLKDDCLIIPQERLFISDSIMSELFL